MVNADDLALQERPHALDILRMDEPAKADILASAVVHREVRMVLAEADKSLVFVS